jgi:hypothetical protein
MDHAMNAYWLLLAGCRVPVSLVYEETGKALEAFLAGPCPEEGAVHIGRWEKKQYLEQFPHSPWNAYAETKCLLNLVSDAMMEQGCFLFHAAAFVLDGRAYLMAGPSGAGKSTMYSLLKRIYGPEISVISGDNPVLRLEHDGGFIVHPSPWNGKEGWGTDRCAPLGGMILLCKGKDNILKKIPPEEAAVPVFHGINTYAADEKHIRLMLGLEEKLLCASPIWYFTNTGTEAAAELLYGYIRKEGGET